MKPIPTLYKPLMSVDIETHEPTRQLLKEVIRPLFQQQVMEAAGNGSAQEILENSHQIILKN